MPLQKPDHSSANSHRIRCEDMRHGYIAPRQRRYLALLSTVAIYAVILGGCLLTLRPGPRIAALAPEAPLTLHLRPLAAPSEPVKEEKPRPEKTESRPQPNIVHTRIQPPPLSRLPPLRAGFPLPDMPAVTAPPPPAEAPASPATTITAPPAPQPSSNARDSWEGHILAALEKQKCYPGGARYRREQGVVYIRFTINRDGHVLTTTVERSSGHDMLDREALATLRRAEPLPAIPADRPDKVELLVPLEFFLRT